MSVVSMTLFLLEVRPQSNGRREIGLQTRCEFGCIDPIRFVSATSPEDRTSNRMRPVAVQTWIPCMQPSPLPTSKRLSA